MLKRDEQLQIEVAPAPNAVGRWTLAEELKAYASTVGEDALDRQKRLAKHARECTCGKQEKADAEAALKGEKSQRLLGHQHLPGCNSYRREAPKLLRAISGKEQKSRYEADRADQLRAALARSREEEAA